MTYDILCELYADVFSDVSSDCETEIFDSDSDFPTTSFRKQLRPRPVVFTSDSATSTNEEQNCEQDSSDTKTNYMWCKT
jgi:hypothetical protein